VLDHHSLLRFSALPEVLLSPTQDERGIALLSGKRVYSLNTRTSGTITNVEPCRDWLDLTITWDTGGVSLAFLVQLMQETSPVRLYPHPDFNVEDLFVF
jgi:hypothetical protein